MVDAGEINLPDVMAEVTPTLARYEAAPVSNDLTVLDVLLWHSRLSLRYGNGEHLCGIAAIRAFRTACNLTGPARKSRNTVITTFGINFTTANIKFVRKAGRCGRQSQPWVHLSQGWHIVAAHVSIIPV